MSDPKIELPDDDSYMREAIRKNDADDAPKDIDKVGSHIADPAVRRLWTHSPAWKAWLRENS